MLYEIDDKGVLKSYDYDVLKKKITYESSATYYLENDLINNESINNYDNYNLNITPYTETNIRYTNYFNPNVNRVSGTGKISKTFNIKDIPNETYKLIMAIKEEVSYSAINNVKVRIYLDSDYEEKTLKKYPINDEYNILTIDITSKKTFYNIKIEIELMSSSIIIGGIKLYKGMPGSYYSYDLKNNLTKIRNGLYNKKYIYNSEGNLIKEVGIKGEYSEAKYSTGRITKEITSTGIIESYVYLSDGTGRLSLKSKNFSLNNDELETSYTYSDRFLSSITDENQITTSYEYDIYGKLTTISEQSTNFWSNRLYVYYNYNLDDTNNSITKEYSNVEYKKVIKSYNNEKDIIYATLKNSSNYSINYIDKKLSNVSINGYKIEDIIYDNYDRIQSKTNGNNNYRYSFIYDSLDNISEIKYDNSLRYKYEYDNYNNILNIKDRYLNRLESYEYDDEKNIVGILLNGLGNKISYEYEYDKLNYKKIKLDGNERYYLYDVSLSDTIFHNLGGIITTNELYYGSIFSNGIELEKNEMYIIPKKIDESDVVTSHTKYQNKDSIYLGSSVEYGININNGNNNKVFISYCFYYSTSSSNRRYLFSVIEEDTYIKSYIDNNSNIIVEVKEHNKTSETIITSVNNLNLNSWNSFILNFKTNSNGCECILIINDKVSTYTSNNYYDVYFMNDIKYHIGYNYENGVTYPIDMYITGLIIGFSDINIDETIKIKKAYSDYVIENNSLETELINTTCHIPELNNSLVYNIFPFLNSFKSLSNIEPKELDVRFVTNDYINNFIYDSDAKRNVLKLDGNKVIYDFDTSDYLRLIAKIKLINSGYKRYIYELKSTNNNLLGLYVNNINKLCISYNNNVYETNIYLNSGLIYTLDLKISISSSTICYIKINENTTYSCVINNTSIISPTVSIGRKHNPEYIINGILGEYSEVYPLNGIIYNMYKTIESMYLDINFINGYSYNLTYDAFERIKNKECRSKNIISLSQSYTYKVSTRLINKEYITYNNQVKERTYSYDLKGYITNISDTTFGSHSYTYNYLGELTKDNNKYYTYDTNGNILTAGNNTYTYDSVIKDRLISVNNNIITYNNSYPLNPTRYKGLTYQYEGKRLKRVSEYDGYEYIDYDFIYNDRGLLIKYDINHSYDDDTDSWDEITNYYYENDKLISEVSDNSRTDYLYDESGNLYGFIRNDTNIYYYIKDITNNIIGIVDENSNLVVKYDYDAYGNIISKTGTLKNSIMYKGYLYISELGMYYCKSRFYVIEWNRFLNGDSINYLDYDNIDSLNLFSYCYNNPVMYSDGDGTLAISTIVLLTLIGVGAVAGGTTAGVIAYNNDIRGWDLAGFIIGGSLIGAAIGGTIGYFAGPGIAGLLSSSGTFGSGFAFAGGLGSAGGISASSLGTIALGGAIGLTATGSIGLTYMLSKGVGPRMGHNQYENKQFNDLCKKHRLTKKEAEILHREISHQNYTYKEIEQLIYVLFGK